MIMDLTFGAVVFGADGVRGARPVTFSGALNHIRQLEALGLTVTITPAQDAANPSHHHLPGPTRSMAGVRCRPAEVCIFRLVAVAADADVREAAVRADVVMDEAGDAQGAASLERPRVKFR
jgi:hypothetical protein